jgi:hypothetical protein
MASTATWFAKHANVVRPSAKTTGLAPRDRARPKTQGIVTSIKQTKFAMKLAKHGKVPLPFPPHVAENVKESRALYNLVKEQAATALPGIVRARRSRVHRVRRGALRQRGGDPEVKVAYYKGCHCVAAVGQGAGHLDPGARPVLGLELEELESVTCCGAGDIHEAEPTTYLHLNGADLAYGESDRGRHADDDLQRLHAGTCGRRLAAEERRRACGPAVNDNLERVRRTPVLGRDPRSGTCSG